MSYLAYKALHIIAVVTWFAGLFYLPRLFVYHAMNKDKNTSETFKVMERKLAIMMDIGAFFTIALGITLLMKNPALMKMAWMHIKLLLVVLLIIYHVFCRIYVKKFRMDSNTHSHKFYRLFNELPTVLLVAIVFLVVLKSPMSF